MSVRKPSVAGYFYPSDPKTLKSQIRSFLKPVHDIRIPGTIRALVVPHAGYMYSGIVAGNGFAYLADGMSRCKNAIIMGPSHYYPVESIATDTHSSWKMPMGNISVMANLLPKSKNAHEREHSIEVEIPFLQYLNPDIFILPVVTGSNINVKETFDQIKTYLTFDSILLISSDLSHFYPYDIACEKDERTIEAVLQGDQYELKRTGEACGKAGLLLMMEIADRFRWKNQLIKYLNSGDTGGNRSEVVGYCSIAYYEQ